jgi:hypothetical protein
MERILPRMEHERVDAAARRQPAPATAGSRLGQRLALKPYGDELLTSSGDFWIFSARLIILAMAAAEAIAWGYMGSLMSQAHPLLAAGIAALFVFTLIWIIDASFMTLDLSRGYYERALSGKKSDLARERMKLAGGVLARVGIVTASLFITAPFLAQAIFADDVREEMMRRNASSIAMKRQEVEQPYAARIDALRDEQQRLEEQRVHEAAGTGLSGRYGRGPALETIERQLGEKREEIAAVEAARVARLAEFDQLTHQQLAGQYGLQFMVPGVRSSVELLDELMKNPQFARAELAVRAFLAFLFLGLLILKAFQPRSIAVYFNEQLHSLYDEYRKGLFDNYLPAAERASAGGSIDPLRFEEWCLETYALIRKEDERRRETAGEHRMHDLLVAQWQLLESTARRELEPLVQRHETLLAALHERESEVQRLRDELEAGAAELRNVERACASMLQIDHAAMDATTFAQASAARRELEERRAALSFKIREGVRAIDGCSKRLEMQCAEAGELAGEITTKRVVIADAQERIANERMKLSSAIAGQREQWSGG